MPNIKRKLCIMKLNAFFEILSSSGLKGLMEYHVSRALFPRIILIAFVLRLDIKEKKEKYSKSHKRNPDLVMIKEYLLPSITLATLFDFCIYCRLFQVICY